MGHFANWKQQEISVKKQHVNAVVPYSQYSILMECSSSLHLFILMTKLFVTQMNPAMLHPSV